MRSSIRIVATVGAIMLANACGRESTEPPVSAPTPGALKVVLGTPNTNDGAVLFTISGGTIDSVTAGDVRMAAGTSGSAGILILGAAANGSVIGRIWVPDVAKVGNYSGTVLQAAARSTYSLQNISSYHITVIR